MGRNSEVEALEMDGGASDDNDEKSKAPMAVALLLAVCVAGFLLISEDDSLLATPAGAPASASNVVEANADVAVKAIITEAAMLKVLQASVPAGATVVISSISSTVTAAVTAAGAPADFGSAAAPTGKLTAFIAGVAKASGAAVAEVGGVKVGAGRRRLLAGVKLSYTITTTPAKAKAVKAATAAAGFAAKLAKETTAAAKASGVTYTMATPAVSKPTVATKAVYKTTMANTAANKAAVSAATKPARLASSLVTNLKKADASLAITAADVSATAATVKAPPPPPVPPLPPPPVVVAPKPPPPPAGPKVNCVGAYGAWGACSTDCDKGRATAAFKVTTAAKNGGSCPSSKWQVCMLKECAVNLISAMPCANKDEVATDCDHADKVAGPLQIVMGSRSSVSESAGHTKGVCKKGRPCEEGGKVMKLSFDASITVKSGFAGPMTMENGRGGKLAITGIHHWAWGGRTMYFYVKKGVSVAAVNAIIKKGDTVTLVADYGPAGRPMSPDGLLQFADEKVKFATAEARCRAAGARVCSTFKFTSFAEMDQAGPRNQFLWTTKKCSPQVQVHRDGQINVVDGLPTGETKATAQESAVPEFAKDSAHKFRIRWAGGKWPAAASGCGSGCKTSGITCLCDISVSTKAVFADKAKLPSIADVRAALFIGTTKPTAGYTKTSAAGYTVYMKGGQLDGCSIFQLPIGRGRSVKYLLNLASTVATGSFSFRNPPHFLPLLGEIVDRIGIHGSVFTSSISLEPTKNEVDALLDHLVEHDNTAPFLAFRMIQRLVTSNPSPRYVKAAVVAFRTGAYGGTTYSGKYGDLSAMVAAILLEPSIHHGSS